MYVKRLKGFSGCDVTLHIDPSSNKKFVRKISSGVPYNSRLISQMKKQAQFENDFLKTPKIYDAGMIGDKFYFDMEFISGVTFHNFISTHSPNSVEHIFSHLRIYLGSCDQKDSDLTEPIQEKINSLRPVIDEKFHFVLDYCQQHDWKHMKSGSCHGDLTFENIIIYKSDVYLIDFLDSFVDTKYVDYAKVLQDLIFMWSWRNSSSSPIIKCMSLYNSLAKDMSEEEFSYTKRLLMLNVLRIVPYADPKTLRYLSAIMSYAENKFDIR